MAEAKIYTVGMDADGRLTTGLTAGESPGDSELLFPWWSVAKTVLATCALQLVGRGRLSLDDPVEDAPYSLRQLLQHRAGVPDYGGLDAYQQAVAQGDAPWPVDELLDRAQVGRLDFAPGQGWNYSNIGYLMVRRIVEQAFDAPVDVAMKELVFDPLGISSVRLAQVPGDLDCTVWGNQVRYHPGWVYHGLLIASAADAVRFLHGLMAGDLLAPDLLATLCRRHRLGGVLAGRPWQSTGYGLGLMGGEMAVDGKPAGLGLGHSGCGPGPDPGRNLSSVCAVYHFPDRRTVCTIAAFTLGESEAVTEYEVTRLAVG